MTSLSSESNISHYKIKGLIASGGMGEVYKAMDLQLGRVVALKTVLPSRAGDSNIHHRFLREARAASILSHPSICTIYEIGEEGGLTFIAMQYLEGKTIETLLREGPLRIDRVLSYALDVAEALEEAHRNGVIHRDIKPSNIIINERQTAVVLDFGLAKQVNLAPAVGNELPTQFQLTSTATLVGTGPYMSPEQILGEPLDARSDIFSFGVTFYEMLVGRRPFDGVTTVDVLHSILHDEAKPINRVRQDLDGILAAIVSKMLAKNKDERYQSARELKDDLLEYIQTKGYAVRSLSGSAPNGTSAVLSRSHAFANRLNRSRAVILVAPILLIAIALVGVLWLVFFRSRGTADSDLATLKHLQLVNWKSAPGESSDGVFSRDGRMIAFSSARGKYRDIWIKQTKMGDANQITKGEWNSWNPIWSPDSQQIAFLSKRGNQSGIWRMPALGGTATFVAALDDGNLRLRYWSKDSGTIYYQSDPDLFALNVTSGQTTRVTNFEASQQVDYLNFSVAPEEDRIAYVDRKDGQMDIWLLPMQGGSPVRLTNDSAEDRNPVWHPDGRRIIYSSLRDGTYQICVASVDGSAPLQLTSGESDKLVSDVSADGAGILYAVSREESDIWGVKINAAAESEVTTEPGAEFWPDVSPDGKTIAYQSIRNPDQGTKLGDSFLFAHSLEREGQKLQLAARGINPTWSPDGSRLAFLRRSGDIWNVWTVSAAGGEEKQLSNRAVFAAFSILPYNRIGNRFYSWSPDASKIAYSSRASDEFRMWVISVNDQQEARISANLDQFYCPIWLPDSSGVAYVSLSNESSSDQKWRIWLAELNANKFEAIFHGPSAMRLLGWSGRAGDLLVATIESQDMNSIRPADIILRWFPRKGSPAPAFATLKSTYLNNIQLSSDGRAIGFVAREDGKDNIWLVSAKGGEAKKLTSNMDPRLYYSGLAFSADSQTIYFGKQSSSSLISMIDNFK